MPISRRAFDNPADALQQCVLDVLRASADVALTIGEILSGLHAMRLAVDEQELQAALADLAARKQIEVQQVFDQWYYCCVVSIGFRLR